MLTYHLNYDGNFLTECCNITGLAHTHLYGIELFQKLCKIGKRGHNRPTIP